MPDTCMWCDGRLQYFKIGVLDAVAQWNFMCMIIQEHNFDSLVVRIKCK